MSLVLKDRVRETTTVLGTGDATLLGAVTGFQSFSVVGNGNTCYYTISDQSGGNWEVGIGTYSTVGPTLTRTTILASSNSGSIVAFPAGTKDVFLTLPAEVAVVSSNNPSTAGYVLSSNGAGVAPSWVAGTSITVGAAGSNTQVQYNNSGVLGASSNFTFDGTNIGLAGGTANGVAYLNGSKVLTTGSALTFDGSALSVVTSSNRSVVQSTNNGGYATWKYVGKNSTGGATSFEQGINIAAYDAFELYDTQNSHVVNRYINGASGYTSWFQNGSEQMRLTSTGLGIGTSSVGAKLDVRGNMLLIDSTTSSLYIKNNSGDSNGLKIYSDGSGVSRINGGYGTLAFETSGTERMRLDSSGNLGLGVTPSAWVYKAIQIGTVTGISDSGSGFTFVTSNAFAGSGPAFKYIGTGLATAYQQSVSGQHAWFTAPSGTAGTAITFTQVMTLDASGNLGIGTSNPSGVAANYTTVDIRGSSGGAVKMGVSGGANTYMYTDSGGSNIFTSTTIPLQFGTNGSERMRIDSSGNVGIGTSSPATKLDVSGTVTATTFSGAWANLPAGTAMLFAQTAAPTGWTKSVTHNDKALRVVSGTASSGGSVAFTTAFASQAVNGSVGTSGSTTATGTVGSTTLSTSQIPSHVHTLSPATSGLVPSGTFNGAWLRAGSSDVSATGGGGSHNHSLTMDAHTHSGGTFTGTAINLAVQYVDVIIATKD